MTSWNRLSKESILKEVSKEPSGLHLFYIGQLGYIFAYRNTFIGIDLFLTPRDRGQWVRVYETPVEISELDFLDYVIVTHDHDDHADPETLRPLSEINEKAKFIVPKAFMHKVISYGIPEERIIPATSKEVISCGDVNIRPVPAAHEVLHQNGEGVYEEMGYVLKFGETTVYHSGDCCIYDGQEEIVGPSDITILPINGRSYYRLKEGIIGNMNVEEAMLLSKNLQAKLFLPAHFDLFRINGVPEEFIPVFHDLYAPDLPMKIPTPGEHIVF